MTKFINKLKDETQTALRNQLEDQVKHSFDKLEDVSKLNTRHVFLVNAGGATATLAFIGTKTSSTFAIWPLLFFVVGVIACGIQLLMTTYVHKEIFEDTLIRRDKFYKENSTVEDILPKIEEVTNSKFQKIARKAYFTAHGSFIVGILSGGIASFFY